MQETPRKNYDDLFSPVTSHTHSRAFSPPAHHQQRWYSRSSRTFLLWAAIGLVLLTLPIGAWMLFQATQRQQVRVARYQPVQADAQTVVPPALDPAHKIARYIDQMVARLSLDEELGQMIIVEFSGTSFNSDLQTMLTKQHAGGTILYAWNVHSIAQTAALNKASQAQAQIPLFISTDQEGGLVNRLLHISGWIPSAQEIGASGDPARAAQRGQSDAQALLQMGINLNLAPVVDVQTVSNSATIIPTRMFGTTPQQVATFAGAYLEALQNAGVIGCIKHWPGLGNATVDPHDALPIFNRSQADLNNIDFAPYRLLMQQGLVNMIMSTHELVPAYDPNLPASLSPILIDQVLRHDLGYQGVVITDGLYMHALARWSVPQAAVLAVLAGNDILLGPTNSRSMQQVLDALRTAIANGQITKARIDQSVERILMLKMRAGLIPLPPDLNQQ
ncbi:MAG TPA: glycoside hydrolase family 3 N-terminal domain-containing protein [Ktedonobacterales bacterium]